MSSKKLPVCINIFPSLDYVELVQFDEKTGGIEKATSLPCQFDPATRQMADRERMAQTIRDLFTMNRIPFNTLTVLVLPSFFTREIELPTEFTKEELRFALVSEAERFYIFKKTEPQIAWINLDESRLLYSAFPKPEIEKYMQTFQELRIPLAAIELNYFSILRGLVSTGAVSAEAESGERWCLLVVSDYSFFASIQEGIRIVKTTDAPLSSTAEDENEAIHEIQQDFEGFTDTEAFGKLIVVNNAGRINSENLLAKLAYHGNLILIEQNALTLGSRGATEGPFPCSLEGIGGIFYSGIPELPRMNFVLETGEDMAGIIHYKQAAMKWLLVANGCLFLLCLLLWGGLTLMIWNKDQQRTEMASRLSQLEQASSTASFAQVNRKKFIKKVVNQNVGINNFMVKLGSSAPANVWLEKIQIDANALDKPLAVLLEGKALSLDEVNQLRNNLAGQFQDIPLEVSNAAQGNSEDGQTYFTWSIQTKGAATPGGQPGTASPAPGDA